MRGAVIIPAFNEADRLGDVLVLLGRLGLAAEVVVVDDGSTDGTSLVAARHGATVLTHLINLGYARALQTGLAHVLRAGGDHCVTLDADGQHDPAFIAALHTRAAAEDRPEIVIGSRFVADRRYDAPLGRRLGMMIFSLLTGLVGGRRIYDTTSGFKWLSRAAMQEVARVSGGDLHSEMIIYALLRGLRVVEAPITVQARKSGQSMYSAASSLIYPLKTLLSIAVLLVQARQQGKVGGA